MQREDIKMLVDKWWDVYVDESLDYINVDASKNAAGDDQKESVAVLSDAGNAHYVTAPSAA